MHNPTSIISGAGALASAFAEKLSGQGFRVALLSRNKPKDFKGVFYECDLTQEQQVKNAVLEAYRELGQFHSAIHTAVSPIIRKKALDMSAKEFADSFLVDAFGGFAFLQSTAVLMKQQGFGRIIALTSEAVESQVPPAGMAGYVCAKFALKGLLKVLLSELKSADVAVNALAPGFMETALNKDLPPRLVEFIREQQGGQLVVPSQVAEVLLKVLALPTAQCTGKTFFISLQKDVPAFHSVSF